MKESNMRWNWRELEIGSLSVGVDGQGQRASFFGLGNIVCLTFLVLDPGK